MIEEKVAQKEAVRQVACLMAAAARTAPKARGVDNIAVGILEEKEKNLLARTMLSLGKESGNKSFLRDAVNVRFADSIVLIGTRAQPLGLTVCGLCGFADCAACLEGKGLCAFNATDLGIAVGSAVSVAAQHHIDNRIMYTIGIAAATLQLPAPDLAIILGIPLSVHGKNPFFDRK
ncbi:MAG: DUF2148 domain-containing protein [Candidatus Ratteibacteria bacterium]|jgi:uncharacterized ferredoxin-like protein